MAEPTPQVPRSRRRVLIRGLKPIRPSTDGERLQRSVRSGGSGAILSFVIHSLLALLLGWLVVQPQSQRLVPPLDLRWLTAREVEESATARAPVRISTVPDGVPTVPKVSEVEAKEPTTLRPTRPVVRLVDVSGSLEIRRAEKRTELARQLSDGGKTDSAVRNALFWLFRQQQSTGKWRLHEGYPQAGRRTARTDTGATALALLAFLGAGFDHQQGEHRKTVGAGLQWLVSQQRSNGNLFDIDEFGREEAYYAHAMATIVLCEAVAMTADRRLRQAALAAIKFLVDSQQPVRGGWKYQPQTELTNGDLSVTGWALMALHTARMAGLKVPDDAFLKASLFLDSVEQQEGARYRYEPKFPVTPAMTAEGLLCRQWLGWPREHPQLESGVRYLLGPKFQPRWEAGRRNVYGWYYTAQVLHNVGGTEWEDWYRAVREEIVSHQLTSGSRSLKGSWHPHLPAGHPDEKSQIAGRLYVTVMCTLILETPYRHAGVYEPR